MTYERVGARSRGLVNRRRTEARVRAGLGLAGPAGLAALLPTPHQLWTRAGSGSDAVDAISSAILLAASVVVWGLLAWALLVASATLLSQRPGAAGRFGRRMLERITPAAARRVLILATGVSLATGLAACGTPPGAGAAAAPNRPAVTVIAPLAAIPTASITTIPPDPLPSTPAPVAVSGVVNPTASATSDATTPGSTPEGAGHAGPARPTATLPLDLDWPLPAPSDQVAAPADPSPAAPAAPAAPPTQTSMGTAQPEALPEAPPTPAPNPTAAPTTPAAPGTHAAPTAPGGITVTVRPGDSLWAIAARHLPPDATSAQIDAAWRSWYAANRGTIGADPDLILPGQHLAAPDTEGLPS